MPPCERSPSSPVGGTTAAGRRRAAACARLPPCPRRPDVDTQALEQWFDANAVVLLIVAVLLLVLYAFSSRIVHAAVARALAAQKGQVEPGSPEAAELDKRAATLSGLVTALLRIVVVAIIVTLIIGFFGLWSLVAGLGLLLAALTLAGQSIVLDYLMGVLIILEGQYFKGDVIAVGAVAGTVEDVGLRRTTVRSADGTVHSISNGEIRIVSNRTRVFAAAEVTIPGIREEDFERVLGIMDDVGREVAQDPRFTASIIETPSVAVHRRPRRPGHDGHDARQGRGRRALDHRHGDPPPPQPRLRRRGHRAQQARRRAP